MSDTKSHSSAFSSLRIPAYRTLWWAGLFSFVAVQMQMLLRSLLAWDLTESERALGEVFLFFGVAMLITIPLGGVAADRLPKRAVMLTSQGILTLSSLSLGLAIMLGSERFWMLLVTAVAQGVAFGLLGPARTAFNREVVGREHLGNAITLTMLSMNGTRIFAPSLAGAMAGVSFLGLGATYVISSGFALISFFMMWRLPNPPPRTTARRNPFRDIVDGVRYVAARPPLRRLILSSMFVIIFAFNYVAFLPSLVEGEFGLGDGSVGLMSTAGAVGAVLAFVPVASRADSPSARKMMTSAGVGFGLGVAALALTPNLMVAMMVAAVIGAMTNAYQSLSNSIALRMADELHEGRVQSLMQLSFAGFGMAAAPLGFLAELVGLRPTLVVMGAVATLSMLLYILFEWRAGHGYGPGEVIDRSVRKKVPVA